MLIVGFQGGTGVIGTTLEKIDGAALPSPPTTGAPERGRP